jgi:hypothetical protein
MARNTIIDGKTVIGQLDHVIMDGFVLIEAFLPVGGICYETRLFNPLDAAPGPLFSTRDYLS